MQWRIQAPPWFFDQKEARRAKKFFFGDRAPPLSQGPDDRVPPPHLKVWIRYCNAHTWYCAFVVRNKELTVFPISIA